MIVGVGHDVFEVARMEAELREGGASLRAALFTPAEVAYCEGKRYPARHFAARFAAKEAVLKALGADPRRGPAWLDIEIVNGASGRPRVLLHRDVRAAAREGGIGEVLLSIAHTAALAAASAVAQSAGPEEVSR
jgi:holo-[acyl-carrier protein] synthase